MNPFYLFRGLRVGLRGVASTLRRIPSVSGTAAERVGAYYTGYNEARAFARESVLESFGTNVVKMRDPFSVAARLAEEEASSAVQRGAFVGTFVGIGQGMGRGIWAKTGGRLGGAIAKHPWQFANAAMLLGIYAGGESLASDLYGAFHRGQGRARGRTQATAIYEQAIYNTNLMRGGYGSPMTFAGGGARRNAIPTGVFSQGYSPEALGATGDMVFALHSLARR